MRILLILFDITTVLCQARKEDGEGGKQRGWRSQRGEEEEGRSRKDDNTVTTALNISFCVPSIP